MFRFEKRSTGLLSLVAILALVFAFMVPNAMACGDWDIWSEIRTWEGDVSYTNFNTVNTSDYATASANNSYGEFGVEAGANGEVSGYQQTMTEILGQNWLCSELDYTFWLFGYHHVYNYTEIPISNVYLYDTLVEDIPGVDLTATSDAFVTGSLSGKTYGHTDYDYGRLDYAWKKSKSDLNIFARSWASTGCPGPCGIAETYAFVNGGGYRNDSLMIDPIDGVITIPDGEGYTFDIMDHAKGGIILGGNYSGGSFSGENYGDQFADVFGGLNAHGETYGKVDAGYNSVNTFGITKSCAMAFQNGIGNVSVEGAGSIFAIGALNQSYCNGAKVSAMTTGQAGYEFSGSGTNFAVGNGVAVTNGHINVSQGCGSVSITASSHSYANSSFHVDGVN